jgi:hypothetical protein
MSQIALIPSMNGFGHTRRLLSLAIALRKEGFSCSVLIPCQLSNSVQISKIVLQKSLDLKTICSDLYLDGPYSNLQNHQACESNFYPEDLHKFLAVISDTLTWVAEFNPHSILIAQFTWEKYYNSNFDDRFLNHKLKKFKKILGLEYFSQEYLSSQSNFYQIPLIDYWGLSHYIRTPHSHKIHFLSSGAEDIAKLVPKNLVKDSNFIIYGLENYLRNNIKPLAAICRPGLGSILECLSSDIVPILLDVPDPELSLNRSITLGNNWAISLEEFQDCNIASRIPKLEAFKFNRKLPKMYTPSYIVRNYILKELREI